MLDNLDKNHRTLIILPGWGGSHETWADFVNITKKEFTDVFVVNMPCFADQECPNEIWGIDEFTEYVKKEIDKVTSDKFILLGHSFGGQVAVNYAVEYPEKIEKLILSGAAVFRLKKIIKRFIFRIISKFGKIIFSLPFIERFDVLAKKILYKTAGSPDYNNTAGIKREIFKKIIRQDLSKKLSHINIPTLVVWGRKDKFVPLKYGKKIAKLIPNSDLYIFKNGGHGLHLHNKEELLAVIRRFVNS